MSLRFRGAALRGTRQRTKTLPENRFTHSPDLADSYSKSFFSFSPSFQSDRYLVISIIMSKKYYERLAKSSGFTEKKFESDFGLKVLKKFGWTEGKGLGKNEDGREETLQQKRRDGNTGLGNEKKATEEKPWENWWADCYNNVAKKISDRKHAASSPSPSPSPSAGRKTSSSAAESDSDSDSDDEPIGGRITAIKSASRMAGKLKRVIRQEAKDPTPVPKKKAEDKKKDEEKENEQEASETEKQPAKKEKKRKPSAEVEEEEAEQSPSPKKEKKRKRSAEQEEEKAEEEAEQEPEEPSSKKKTKSKKKRTESGEEEEKNAEATPRSSPERQ